MPGKNATGTNTATSTSADHHHRAEHLAHRVDGRLVAAFACTSRMCRSMFSITTIASSTTMPVASTMPNSVSVLIEKPNSLTKANVPIERHRDRHRRDDRAAPVLQEQEHHEHDQHDRLDQRLQHLADRLARRPSTLSKAMLPLEPGREALRRAASARAHHSRRRRRARWPTAAAARRCRRLEAVEAQVRGSSRRRARRGRRRSHAPARRPCRP